MHPTEHEETMIVTDPIWFELPWTINHPEFIVCRRIPASFHPGIGLSAVRDLWELEAEVDAEGNHYPTYRAVRGSERYYLNAERIDRETWEAKYQEYERLAQEQAAAQ